jgi:hypothetical protein
VCACVCAARRLVGPRLSRIPQRTLVLAGGQDVVLDSEKEAKRLADTMPRAFRKVRSAHGACRS